MKSIDGVDFREYLEFCGKQESQSLVPLSSAAARIWDRMQQGPSHFGDPLPWQKTHGKIRFRPGEISVWAGMNGHGKSLVLSHCSIVWMLYGPVAVASLEMPIDALGERFSRQALGRRDIGLEDFGRVMASTDEKYWIYDETDTVESERVLGMAIYAIKELGCRHVIIDSLVKCGLRMGDASAQEQKSFVDRLCWIAKTYRAHIHLVHHMRKGNGEYEPGNKMDVKGAGEITDLADNVLLQWRNKPKENRLAKGEQDDGPDAVLTVAKQRHGEWEGPILLWLDKTSQQFTGTSNEHGNEIIKFEVLQ